MSWTQAMAKAHQWSRKYGVRMRVSGYRFHDAAGLVSDEWFYRVEYVR